MTTLGTELQFIEALDIYFEGRQGSEGQHRVVLPEFWECVKSEETEKHTFIHCLFWEEDQTRRHAPIDGEFLFSRISMKLEMEG